MANLKTPTYESQYFRSGSSLTGKLLTQGQSVPNYVYEPMAFFLGQNLSELEIGPEMRTELIRVFAMGQPQDNSPQAGRSTRGINIKKGGDVVTKTIRLRYSHIRGWIEDQESIKVNFRC